MVADRGRVQTRALIVEADVPAPKSGIAASLLPVCRLIQSSNGPCGIFRIFFELGDAVRATGVSQLSAVVPAESRWRMLDVEAGAG
jgi:hypothetical protein